MDSTSSLHNWSYQDIVEETELLLTKIDDLWKRAEQKARPQDEACVQRYLSKVQLFQSELQRRENQHQREQNIEQRMQNNKQSKEAKLFFIMAFIVSIFSLFITYQAMKFTKQNIRSSERWETSQLELLDKVNGSLNIQSEIIKKYLDQNSILIQKSSDEKLEIIAEMRKALKEREKSSETIKQLVEKLAVQQIKQKRKAVEPIKDRKTSMSIDRPKPKQFKP
jgi:hypothetical protein